MATPSITYQLSNGTTADASQVLQNFNDILNGYTDGTRDLTFNNLTTNGSNVLGSNSADNLTINATLISHIIPTNTTYTLGDSTHNFTDLFLDNGATDGGSVQYNAGGSAFTSSADGLVGTYSGFTSLAATTVKNMLNVTLTYDGGANTILKSVNVTSVTDNGTGDYTVNFTTAFADAVYSAVLTHSANGSVDTGTRAVGSLQILTRDSGGSLVDPAHVALLIAGNRT